MLRRLLGKRMSSGGSKFPSDFDDRVVRIIERVRAFTMTSPERLHSLIRAVEYVVRNDIPGDVVECGVWKGGSMMAVASTLLELGTVDRALYLFDTFEGMTSPEELDRTFRGDRASDLMATADREQSWIWAVSALDEVKAAMDKVGYDRDKVVYVQGDVADTLPRSAPPTISLLRLDTDWYKSTWHELEHLYPRLSVGGVLIIDDYGHWEGARRAVDEFIEAKGLRLFLSRIDYTGRLAIKLDP